MAPRIEQPASVLAGFSADIANRGGKPGSIWLKRSLATPTPEEAMTLALSPDSKVVQIARVRTADDEPLPSSGKPGHRAVLHLVPANGG